MYSFIYLSAEKALKFYLLKKTQKPCNNTYRLSVFELPPFYHHPSATFLELKWSSYCKLLETD